MTPDDIESEAMLHTASKGNRLNDATPEDWDRASQCHSSSLPKEPRETVVSDGGSTAYYELPRWASELRHLMEYKQMTPDQANIFKAAYRLGEKQGTGLEYDLNKIVFFANCMLERLDRDEPKVDVGHQKLNRELRESEAQRRKSEYFKRFVDNVEINEDQQCT